MLKLVLRVVKYTTRYSILFYDIILYYIVYSRRFAVTARPQRSRSAGQRATKSPRTGPSEALDKFKPKVDPSAACPINGKNALPGLFKADKVNSLGPFPSIFKGC